MAKKKLTDRDNDILEFLHIYKLASTRQLYEWKFSCLRYTQERMTELHKRGCVKRWQPRFGDDYLYYIKKKPERVTHALMGSGFAIKLMKMGANIVTVKKEFVMGDTNGHWVKVDYLFRIEYKGYKFNLAVEVENTKLYDTKKYEILLRNGNYTPLKHCPLLVVVTDKKVPPSKLFTPLVVDAEFSNMEVIENRLREIIGNG